MSRALCNSCCPPPLRGQSAHRRPRTRDDAGTTARFRRIVVGQLEPNALRWQGKVTLNAGQPAARTAVAKWPFAAVSAEDHLALPCIARSRDDRPQSPVRQRPVIYVQKSVQLAGSPYRVETSRACRPGCGRLRAGARCCRRRPLPASGGWRGECCSERGGRPAGCARELDEARRGARARIHAVGHRVGTPDRVPAHGRRRPLLPRLGPPLHDLPGAGVWPAGLAARRLSLTRAASSCRLPAAPGARRRTRRVAPPSPASPYNGRPRWLRGRIARGRARCRE